MEILNSDESQMIKESAYGVIAKQFEDIFQGAYYEAIHSLNQNDRVRLFTLAALGAPNYSWDIEYILHELIEFRDVSALPAFERWVTEIDAESFSIQNTAGAYAIAQAGCALFKDSPSVLGNLESDIHRAWQAYGEILFWINKPSFSNDEILKEVRPLWDQLRTKLPFEAVDPLMHLWTAGTGIHVLHERSRIRTLADVSDMFIEAIRGLLEFGLANRSRLPTLFERTASYTDKQRTQFMITELGEIGNLQSIQLLEPVTESPEYGSAAVEAIRTIKRRGQ